MTRRTARPDDRHDRRDRTSGDREAGDREASGREAGDLAPGAGPLAAERRRETIVVALFWAGALLWAALFFAHGRRYEWLALLLVPEVLVKSWSGGGAATWFDADRVRVLAAAAALTSLAGLWGDRLLALLGVASEPRSRSRKLVDRFLDGEHLGLTLAAGLALVSLVTLLVGLAGWLHQPAWVAGVLATVTGALVGGAWWRGRGAAGAGEQEATDGHIAAPAEPWTAVERMLVAFLIASSLVYVAGGVQPPWEFDVREYHLQAPKEWWRAGRIEFLPHNVYANMPLGAELFALLPIVFWPGDDGWWFGALAGKTVIAAVAPLSALLLAALGRRLGSRRAGLAAAALYLALPWTAHVALAGLIDGVLAMYALAAALAMQRLAASDEASGATSEPARWAALAGWFAGAAAACKYPGLALVVAPCGLWTALRRMPGGVAWRHAAAFAVAASIAGGSWYVKNAWQTGNPTYPLLVGVFGGATRTPEKDAQWKRAHRQRDAEGRSYSVRQFAESIAQVGWRSDWQNPVLVPLAAAGAWFGRRRRDLRRLAAFAAWIFATWWLVGHRIDRFWLPASPLLAMSAGWAVGGAGITEGPWRRGVLAVLGPGLAFGAFVVVSPLAGDLRLLAPLEQLRAEGRSPEHETLDRLVLPGGRALLVGDAQPFDLGCDAWYSTCFDDSPLEPLVVGRRTAEERRGALHATGITHVLVDWGEIARYRQPGNYGFPEFVTEALFEELTAAPAVLRRLPGAGPGKALYEVVPPASGAAD